MAKYLKTGSNGITQGETVSTSAGAGDSDKIPSLNGSGKLDNTFFPDGIGEDTLTVTAGETLAANDLIYINGSGAAMKADANSIAKEAIGHVKSGITNAATGTVYFGKGIISGLSGLTPGAKYFLSATTAGGIALTVPSGSGDIIQEVGRALSATELVFNPQISIELI